MENFTVALSNVTPDMIAEKRAHVCDMLDKRIAREAAKGTTLPAKLGRHKIRFTQDGVLRVLCVMGISLDFVLNEGNIDGVQFCEKALGRALDGISRATNYAIPCTEDELNTKGNTDIKYISYFVRNAARLAELGEEFTSELQCFTASNKFTPKGKRPSGLLRHTVALETARRQAGLTRQALLAMGLAQIVPSGDRATIKIDLEHPLSVFYLQKGE